MSKEALEEIKTLRGFNQVELNNDKNINKSLDVIEQALQELQAIKNAKPSEALEGLKAGCFYDNERAEYVEDTDEFKIIKQALIKAQEQSIEEKMPIKDLVSKHIINHNSIVEVYEQDKNNPHYSNKIFMGMAWEMEKHPVGNRKLKYIFSALAEGKTDFDSDRICIEVEDE